MPQLNPAPWLKIFLFAWLIFLTIIPHKVLEHSLPNQCSAPSTQTGRETTWIWPWY